MKLVLRNLEASSVNMGNLTFGHEQTLRKSVADTFTEGKRRASLLPVRSHQPSVVLTSEDPAAQRDH